MLSNDLTGSIVPLKYYQKPPHFFQSKISGGVGTTIGAGIASNNMSRDNFQSEFSQVSWSHDGTLLAAAIHNKILVFDVRKITTDSAQNLQSKKPA